MTFRQKTPSEANVENSETFQASLSETSSRRRQKETLNACKEIHGDQKGKKSSALAGMWVTLVNKSSTDTLKDFLSNSETVSKKIMPSIVKSETELYQSGNDNICRSLKILYEGGLLTKEKYKSVCRNILATVPNSSNVFNPKLLYYDKLIAFIKSANNVDNIRDFSAEFCQEYDKLEDQVAGSYRELGNFLVVLAELYIVVDQTLPTPFLHHFGSTPYHFRMGGMGKRDGGGHPTNNFSKALYDSGLTV